MKKFLMTAIGSFLFVAGYFQTRKQVEYVATKDKQDGSTYTQKPIVMPLKARPAYAFPLSRFF